MRYALMLVLLLSAACAAVPAVRQVSEIDAPEGDEPFAAQRDRVEIVGCVDFHADDDHICIGTVTRRCAEAFGEGAGATGVMVLCATREQRAWALMLDGLAEQARMRESASQIALLDTALAQGEAWSDARCAYEASVYEGGSLARVVAAQCRRDVTAERAISLHRRLIE